MRGGVSLCLALRIWFLDWGIYSSTLKNVGLLVNRLWSNCCVFMFDMFLEIEVVVLGILFYSSSTLSHLSPSNGTISSQSYVLLVKCFVWYTFSVLEKFLSKLDEIELVIVGEILLDAQVSKPVGEPPVLCRLYLRRRTHIYNLQQNLEQEKQRERRENLRLRIRMN